MTEHSNNIRHTTRSIRCAAEESCRDPRPPLPPSFLVFVSVASLPRCTPALEISTLYSNPLLVQSSPLVFLRLPLPFSASSVLIPQPPRALGPLPQMLTRRNPVVEPGSPAEGRVNRAWVAGWGVGGNRAASTLNIRVGGSLKRANPWAIKCHTRMPYPGLDRFTSEQSAIVRLSMRVS